MSAKRYLQQLVGWEFSYVINQKLDIVPNVAILIVTFLSPHTDDW